MTRNGIRGFAAGLLIATIIFGSYYYLNKTDEEKKLSLSELNEASEKLGYTLVKKDKKSDEDPAPVITAQPTTYKLVIVEGMSSEDIGAILKKNHIIQDTSLFASYLRKHELTTKIQIGEYPITSDMTTAQIASVITQ
ncbi:endolytic transglycosylase MltG [Bacillus massiliigorillae]|uniref:endolytic transglycosylase MltG n=1 Tax=Bacillus massiliigorillae TaxID=1243664 RepID=UPI0003A80EC0|nr:endolytic transglycosylase MltG [Bacillus massiliigorillae]